MIATPARFANRTVAGLLLAERLVEMTPDRPVVFALPRGGVPVALQVARAIRAPLDLILVRKIGAPNDPELALAVLVDGEPCEMVVNEDVRRMTGASAAYLEQARARAQAEIERRRVLYLHGRRRVNPAGHTAIVVDDGLATGATAKVALTAIRRQGAARVILAVPVAPDMALAEMRAYADEVVCLHPAPRFFGVSAFYRDFHQLTDDETIALLRKAPAADTEAPPR